SFGKGSVQNLFPLESGRSALKLTTARYYRPNGHNIHRGANDTEADQWGVRPDPGFEVSLDDQQSRRALRRWEIATYPNFPAAIDAPEDPPGTLAEIDPQLWRAVEAIQPAGG